MKILLGVGLHALCPLALKRYIAFFKNENVQEKYLGSVYFVTKLLAATAQLELLCH